MPRLRWNAPECFYSQLDEDVFFAWLHSITAVRRVESGGNGLVIWLKTRHLSKSALYDGVPMTAGETASLFLGAKDCFNVQLLVD